MAVVIYDGSGKGRKKWRAGWLLLGCFLVGVMAVTAWTLIGYKTDDIRDDRYYESLREEYPFRGAVVDVKFADVPEGVSLEKPVNMTVTPPETPLSSGAPEPDVQTPVQPETRPVMADTAGGSANNAASSTVNSTVTGVAWIYCPGTPIDYPVMPWASDDYWLSHLPNGKYSAKGTPFLDARCDDITANVIIYAHNMIDGSMFGSLKNYADAGYMAAHNAIWLYAGDDAYRFDVLAAYYTDISDDCYLMPDDISDIVEKHGGKCPDDMAHYAILSTCAYDRGDERFVVILAKS